MQDVLVSLGTSASYLYSLFSMVMCFFLPHYQPFVFFETSAMLITFISLGKYLEYVAKGRTSEAIQKLMSLQVPSAHTHTARTRHTRARHDTHTHARHGTAHTTQRDAQKSGRAGNDGDVDQDGGR